VDEGTLKLRVVKQVDALRERVFERDVRMAAGTIKRLDVELGPIQPSAKARLEEEERMRQQQALAAQRAAEERQAEAQAASRLLSKAEAGDLPSMLALAERFYKAKDADSLKQAGIWFRKAADAGSPQGIGGVGSVFYATRNPIRDEVQAVQWWRRGIDAGDGRSMYAIGNLSGTGESGVAKDLPRALELISKAAQSNYAPAMTRLAVLYYKGDMGLARDLAEGVKWYRRAAELGESMAMVNLGYAYEQGQGGLARDDATALDWYRKAAAQDNADARPRIAILEAKGVK